MKNTGWRRIRTIGQQQHVAECVGVPARVLLEGERFLCQFPNGRFRIARSISGPRHQKILGQLGLDPIPSVPFDNSSQVRSRRG
jgi:hypothetical protein